MITNEHLVKLQNRLSKLKTYLDIDKKLIEISNEEEKTANPNFWNNSKEAEIVMKNLRIVKKWVDDYNLTASNYEDLAVLLKNNNYSNFISIEMKNPNNLDEVKECISYIRGVF